MLACRSHSDSSTASSRATRPIPISITSAIVWLEFSSVSSSRDSSSNTSGPSELEPNLQPHNEIVEEHRIYVVDLRMLRMCASGDGENDRAARSNDRRER